MDKEKQRHYFKEEPHVLMSVLMQENVGELINLKNENLEEEINRMLDEFIDRAKSVSPVGISTR